MSFNMASSKGTLQAISQNLMMYSTIDELPCLRSSSWSNGSIPGQGSLEKLLNPSLAKSSVMTGLRQVDSLAARCLLSRGRNKRAMVSRQKQEYQRQSRDVNNTRQGSRSQAQVQSSKVGQSGVKHRDGRKNNAQNVSQGKTRLRTG